MENNYVKAKSLIQKQLNIVILNDRTKLMLQNENFLNEVVKNVSALKAIEESLLVDKSKMLCYKYLDKINVSIKNKQFFVKFKLPKNEIDLIDNIKFINSLAINLFGKDLENIGKDSLNSSIVLPFENPKKEEANKTSTENKNFNKSNKNSNQSTNNNYNYGNPNDYKESYINQMAMQRLSNEIREGKVFIYSHKPKAVIWIKYAASIFYFLFILLNSSFIIYLIFLAVSKTSYTYYQDASGSFQLLPGPTSKTFNLFESLGSILNYLYPIIYILIFSYFLSKNISSIKQNDNVKYTMKTFGLVIASIFGLFSLITNLSTNTFQVIEELKAFYPDTLEQSFKNLNFFKILIILSIVCSSGMVLCFVFLIPYWMLKPKLNVQLQMELLSKYKDEIKSLNNL